MSSLNVTAHFPVGSSSNVLWWPLLYIYSLAQPNFSQNIWWNIFQRRVFLHILKAAGIFGKKSFLVHQGCKRNCFRHFKKVKNCILLLNFIPASKPRAQEASVSRLNLPNTFFSSKSVFWSFEDTGLEFLNILWGLGTEYELGYSTGPPGYLGWRNWFLGIDSRARLQV